MTTHEWVQSRVGHGNKQCHWCFITDLEAAIRLYICEKAPEQPPMTLDKEALEAATKVRHDLAEKGLEKFGITPLSWEALEQEYKDEDMASMSAAITAYLDKSGIAEELKQLRSAVKYCAQQLSTADHIFSKVVRVTVTVEEEKP